MDFNEYQHAASETAIYPEKGEGTILAIAYCTLGAASEAGEIAGKVKKMIRDDNMVLTPERARQIRQEIGGNLWYLSQLLLELKQVLGVDESKFDFAAQENADILLSRKAREVIKGDGDNR